MPHETAKVRITKATRCRRFMTGIYADVASGL
jgi:hypothetical protein